MALPKHKTAKVGMHVLLTFDKTLTPEAERQVHKHLAGQYPGAAIATIGDRQVSVDPPPRPRK